MLVISLSLNFFHCTSPTNPTDNHCTTEELIERLRENSPSLSDCSPLSIRRADMAVLRGAGIIKRQFLAVWSSNGDTGFTPAQLLAAGISIAEMQSNNITLSQIYNGGVSITYLLRIGLSISQLYDEGIPGYALFNEACNIPLSSGTSPNPTIRLLSTRLVATNTHIVLEGGAAGTVRWEISSIGSIDFDDLAIAINDTRMLGSAKIVYLGMRNDRLISTLNLPFEYVFSNLTVTLTGSQLSPTSIQLCPGR